MELKLADLNELFRTIGFFVKKVYGYNKTGVRNQEFYLLPLPF
jgi:hypothetical protein